MDVFSLITKLTCHIDNTVDVTKYTIC